MWHSYGLYMAHTELMQSVESSLYMSHMYCSYLAHILFIQNLDTAYMSLIYSGSRCCWPRRRCTVAIHIAGPWTLTGDICTIHGLYMSYMWLIHGTNALYTACIWLIYGFYAMYIACCLYMAYISSVFMARI